jgi:hypothetical protein
MIYSVKFKPTVLSDNYFNDFGYDINIQNVRTVDLISNTFKFEIISIELLTKFVELISPYNKYITGGKLSIHGYSGYNYIPDTIIIETDHIILKFNNKDYRSGKRYLCYKDIFCKFEY